MYVNVIDTLQKNYQMIFLHLGKKIWKFILKTVGTYCNELRTITSSGSGDTLAVSRVDQLGDIIVLGPGILVSGF